MIFGRQRIYADYASTTPVARSVACYMRRAEKKYEANPSAIYEEGVRARAFIEGERTKVAKSLGVKSDEIYFTSGGTEANATIIQGVLRTRLERGIKDVHVVSTSIEHSSVLETLRLFEKHGVRVTYVAPGPDGVVRAEDVLKAITPATALVSVMFANNEIGTIQPVSKIGAGVRKIRAEKVGRDDAAYPIFHVDASQSPLYLSCEMEGLRADAMTLDAHKMYGPRGVGALIVRRHVSWEPLMAGGGQERGMRPTTESVSLIAGFTRALEIAIAKREERKAGAQKVRDALFALISHMPNSIVNGSLEHRLPNNVNISILNLSDAELAVLKLDHESIACSTKSSCLKGETESYVVRTLGGDPRRARTTLRFTFGIGSRVSHARRIARALHHLSA